MILSESPLHYSAIMNHSSICERLLDYGIDVDVTDCHMATPLHHACINANVDVAKLLLEKNANLEAKTLFFPKTLFIINSLDVSGIQP